MRECVQVKQLILNKLGMTNKQINKRGAGESIKEAAGSWCTAPTPEGFAYSVNAVKCR